MSEWGSGCTIKVTPKLGDGWKGDNKIHASEKHQPCFYYFLHQTYLF